MTDAYLSIAAIANDSFMTERVRAAATQQAHLGAVPKIEEPGLFADKSPEQPCATVRDLLRSCAG
jgi:hypothetical protein